METLIPEVFNHNNFQLTTEEPPKPIESQPSIKHHFHSRKGKKEDLLQFQFDAKFADAALRQASSAGFLVSPTKKLLLNIANRLNDDNGLIPTLQEIKYIHLTNHRIRTLGYIQSCRFLTICILHNNYLTRFSALENCPYLKRLDLHSNQIVKIPDENFWVEMKQLLVLNLHDNGIAKLDSIEPLSKCVNLTALTLYDTPLSLKPSYRHHVVNSIWSLKALDHHVIGDDEIIEDAIFSKRFRALNPCLFVDLCPKETEDKTERTLKAELMILSKILSAINQRLKHGSPVIVAQRWIRGHLSRRKLGKSYLDISTKLKKLNLLPADSSAESQGGETFSLDYDTYLKNRRPGSKTPSASTTLRAETPSSKMAAADTKTDDFDMKLPPQFRINLDKLEENTYRAFGNNLDQNITIFVHKNSALPAKSLFAKSLRVSVEKQLSAPTFKSFLESSSDEIGDKQKDLMIHQIPGQLPEQGEPKQDEKLKIMKKDVAIQCVVDSEIPNHEWRIHDKKIEVLGEPPAIAELEPLSDHVISNRESGKDVREAIEYWHDCGIAAPRRKIVKAKTPPKLKDAVSLATLMAVTKAYRDRDRSDSLAMKVDRVMRIQQERMQSRQIVAAYKDEKRLAALSQRQDDRLRVAEAVQQTEARKSSYIELAQERKQRGIQRHQKTNREFLFAADFNSQHISVSNALIRHDRQTAKEVLETEKREITNTVKFQLFEQAEMVKRFVEHKQLTSQVNASKEKARLDTRLAQDNNERFMQSRQRVATMKAKKAAIQAYHHSLPAPSKPSFWPGNTSLDAGMSSPLPVPSKDMSPLPPLQNFSRISDIQVDSSVVHGSSISLPPVHAMPLTSTDNQVQPSTSTTFLVS